MITPVCPCFTCQNKPDWGFKNPVLMHMVVCPVCGNKRCPKATLHTNFCTGSNEPGQPGSRYSVRWATGPNDENGVPMHHPASPAAPATFRPFTGGKIRVGVTLRGFDLTPIDGDRWRFRYQYADGFDPICEALMAAAHALVGLDFDYWELELDDHIDRDDVRPQPNWFAREGASLEFIGPAASTEDLT